MDNYEVTFKMKVPYNIQHGEFMKNAILRSLEDLGEQIEVTEIKQNGIPLELSIGPGSKRLPKNKTGN